MARQVEKGISYFPLDTGLFSDRKIRRLLGTFGARGLILYIFVLCEVYKDKGYFVECDDDFFTDCAYSLNMAENLVREVVLFCVKNGLFDKRVFDVEHALTSSGIQKRYMKVKARSNVAIEERYKVSCIEKGIPATENGIPVAEKTINAAIIATKEKKRKEKEVDVGNGSTSQYPPTPTTDFSVLASCQQLAPVDTLVSELMGEGVFREYCRMQYRLADSELDAYLERFRMFLHATDEHRKSRKDCKTHFLNWLRVQVSQDRKDRPAQERESVTAEPDARQIARVRELYPQNNFYAEKLYRNYINEHGLHPDVALEHFERAHRNGLTYGMLLFRIQTDHVMLFKN